MTSVSGPAFGEFKVAYLMTHYPRVALTFISTEIDEVERLGGEVHPIVMNVPEANEAEGEDAQSRQRRSHYLKASRSRLVLSAFLMFAAHPLRMVGLAVRAMFSARSDLALLVRRLAHLCYAADSARYCRARGILHLHAHFGLAPATIAWFAAAILNFRAGTQATWSFTIHGFQDFIDESDARLDLKAGSASFVVCVSDFTRSQLCRVADVADWDKFHIVRCGIDLDQFALRDHAPENHRPRLVTVGRLSPEKGQLTLIRAMRRLEYRGLDVELLIVGDGPFRARIVEEATQLDVLDRVSLAGQLPPHGVRECLASADIFCLPSFSEGLPISLMEAMAMGVPVVTTWISGIPELAENDVTAMTVPPANDEALALAIERLIEDGSIRKRLELAARSKVELMHASDRNAANLVDLFLSQVAKTD